MEPLIGQIILFAGNFAPKNWALCHGAELSISDYQSLFSILGTTYGGDGRTSFALPDLRGRTPIGDGNGTGLTNRSLGGKSGAETVTLSTSQIPNLSGTLKVNTAEGTSADPTGHYPATHKEGVHSFHTISNATMASDAVQINGTGGSSHDNMPPYLTLNYIIALEGTYPSRN